MQMARIAALVLVMLMLAGAALTPAARPAPRMEYPLLIAAMSDVDPSEAGLASGVVNTAFMMGGALGLAVLASLAAARTDSLLASGEDSLTALNGGYHAAFLLGAVFAAASALVAYVLLREPAGQPEHAGEPVPAEG